MGRFYVYSFSHYDFQTFYKQRIFMTKKKWTLSEFKINKSLPLNATGVRFSTHRTHALAGLGSKFTSAQMPTHESLPRWPAGSVRSLKEERRGPELPSLCGVTLGESSISLCTSVLPLPFFLHRMGTKDSRAWACLN